MKVCCVIVTYANRFHLLCKVLNEVIEQGVENVIVIDNGSVEDSAENIAQLAKNNPRVTVHRFPTNEGSAKGFKTGLEIASQSNCDFIWMLDDDNLPLPGALFRLQQFWVEFATIHQKEASLALLSMRHNRNDFIKVLQERKPDAILQPLNSFLGFHINQLFIKLKERIQPGRKEPAIIDTRPMKVTVAPYGGLFIHKRLLEKANLPNESFVLYKDDFDFTYRITKSGCEIWLIPESIIEDIDQSYYFHQRKKLLYHSSLDVKKDALAYYNVRNSVYFALRYLTTRKSVFYLNKTILMMFISLAAIIRGKFSRLGLIYEAIQDGTTGNLGKKEKYKL